MHKTATLHVAVASAQTKSSLLSARVTICPAGMGRLGGDEMADPCEPPGGFHHTHGPARIIGRIRRHGTRRVAHQLHPGSSGCLTGKAPVLVRPSVHRPTLVKKILGTTGAPAGLAALAAAAPGSAAGTADPATNALDPGPYPGGTATPQPGRPAHHPPVSVGEPASLPLLLLGLLAVTTIRQWLRPRAASRSRPGAAIGRS